MLPVREILRVVFDTNVLAAALRSKNGASYQLISLLFANKFKIAVSLPLYMEYLDVLLRPTVKPTGISDADILDFVDEILQHAQTQNIYFLWRPWLKDAKDDMILELAIASQADYIVTFNLKDFRNIELFGIEAITPKDFLNLVRNL
ncbi:MAG: putative toxin-antitoxin system toxin component, PIN family [Acidobacteriota bacterium]|nr:putative toxin-antitoxin system toxin component, PIN family [Acidobacteriota bacterium]